MTYILGISAYYHDSAAALVCDGEIIAAAQEERFSRKKHDSRFPGEAVAYCLRESGLELSGIDFIVFYDKPLIGQTPISRVSRASRGAVAGAL